MSLSVIIPTIGRGTLKRAEASCAEADEIIVIPNSDGDHGYSARERGAALATGTHLAFLDDDDIYTAGAIELMRDAACDRPVIFRMDHYRHGILWREPVLEFGNVSTQMFVVPNNPDKLGRWYPHIPGLKEPGGDFSFISGCVQAMGEPVWREEIVAKLRPQLPRGIAIVTPWHDGHEFIDGYMNAVSFRSPLDELIVIDNGSDPPISIASDIAIDTIRLEENLGFSGASNLGLRMARSEAVLFLNNDVVPQSPDWLESIREMLEPGVFVGAQLRYDKHGQVDGEPHPYLDGWCLAGTRDDLDMIGGWDESFDEPSYYGDNDLCFRARMVGITLKEASVPITHLRDTRYPVMPSPRIQQVTLDNKRRFESRVRESLGAAV